MKNRGEAFGRKGCDIKIFGGTHGIRGKRVEEGEEKYEGIKDVVCIEEGVDYVGGLFEELELSELGVDGGFGDIGEGG